jgi:hypothetical protein
LRGGKGYAWDALTAGGDMDLKKQSRDDIKKDVADFTK